MPTKVYEFDPNGLPFLRDCPCYRAGNAQTCAHGGYCSCGARERYMNRKGNAYRPVDVAVSCYAFPCTNSIHSGMAFPNMRPALKPPAGEWPPFPPLPAIPGGFTMSVGQRAAAMAAAARKAGLPGPDDPSCKRLTRLGLTYGSPQMIERWHQIKDEERDGKK